MLDLKDHFGHQSQNYPPVKLLRQCHIERLIGVLKIGSFRDRSDQNRARAVRYQKYFFVICIWPLCWDYFFSGRVKWTMNEKQRMVWTQKKQFHLPNMNTIRRSGSIFLTPFPISTATFGFSTIVFRRLKSNLEPSFSSFSLGVLVPQPIVAMTTQSR